MRELISDEISAKMKEPVSARMNKYFDVYMLITQQVNTLISIIMAVSSICHSDINNIRNN